MGEARRRMEMGLPPRGMKTIPPGGQMQVQVDMKNAVQTLCKCGGAYFQPAVMLFKVSALVSPIGRALTIQKPCFVCPKCQEVFDLESDAFENHSEDE